MQMRMSASTEATESQGEQEAQQQSNASTQSTREMMRRIGNATFAAMVTTAQVMTVGALRLSLANPIQATLLYFLTRQSEFNNHLKEFIDRTNANPSVMQRVNSIREIAHHPRRRQELSQLVREFYAAMALPPSGPGDDSNSEDGGLAKKIANSLWLKWVRELDLTADDVYAAFLEHIPNPKKIAELDDTFLDQVKNTLVDPDSNGEPRYALKTLFPSDTFLNEALVKYRGPLFKAIRNLNSPGRAHLTDPRTAPAERLFNEIHKAKSKHPEDNALLTEIENQTTAYLKDPSKHLDAYQKLSNQISRRSWGKIIGGAILALVGATLIGLCCATGVGAIAAPVLAWGLSYLISGYVLGGLSLSGGIGLFAKGVQENTKTAAVGKEMHAVMSASL